MSRGNVRVSGQQALGEEPVTRLVLRFSATTLIALVLNSIYTLTDALFISWGVGDNAMGGVSIVFPFVLLQGAISSALGGGAASLVSRKLGAGRPEAAGRVTFHAMVAFYVSAIVITAAGFLLMEPLLKMMGVTGELYAYAKEYFIIVLAGNLFSTGFSSIIRAEGKMAYGLLIWVIPVSINIVLDAVFVLVLRWGVAGSALATVLCQFTSFAMCILFFTRFTVQKLRGSKWSFKQLGEILAMGLPSLVQMGSLSLLSMVLNNVLRQAGGTLGVNAFAYISKLVTFGIVPLTAVTQALAPIVGFNYGAGNKKRVNDTLRFSVGLMSVYAVLAVVLTQVANRQLIGIFTDHETMLDLASQGLRVIALSLLFMPLPMAAGAMYQAVGKKGWALLLYAANLLFFLPCVLLFMKPFGLSGVWWAYVCANAAAAALACGKLLVSGVWRPSRDPAGTK